MTARTYCRACWTDDCAHMQGKSVRYGWGSVDRCAFTLCGARGYVLVSVLTPVCGVMVPETRAFCAEHAALYVRVNA